MKRIDIAIPSFGASREDLSKERAESEDFCVPRLGV